MKGLFDGRDSELLKVLSHRPKLSDRGWDIPRGGPVENIHGRLLRELVREGYLLQLSREGILMFLGKGDAGYLSYPLHHDGLQPYRLNPFVLAYCVYDFALLADSVYKFAEPGPSELVYVLELRNMENSGQPALLHPGHGRLNAFLFDDRYKKMPHDSKSFEIRMPFGMSPGVVWHKLLAEVYQGFGFDIGDIPYSRSEDGVSTVDDIRLFGTGHR